MAHFAKSKRLLTKPQYDQVFAQAKKLVVSEFILLYRENKQGHARLGLAISKKTIAKAHDRNRIKRLIRETFRLTVALPAIDIIVLAKPGISKVERSLVRIKLSQAWNKLSTTCEK